MRKLLASLDSIQANQTPVKQKNQTATPLQRAVPSGAPGGQRRLVESYTGSFMAELDQHARKQGIEWSLSEQYDRFGEGTAGTDSVSMDIPLLIRMFEYAREDAKTDMELHDITERLIALSDQGTLTMADYDKIVTDQHSMDEAEGEPEGLPHVTREMIHHILQQIRTDGPRALSKSIEWGDGAADDLMSIFQHALHQALKSKSLDEACWKGYRQLGTKNKGGRQVPNCVPSQVEEAKGLKKRVRVVQGPNAGQLGWIREVLRGAHASAPKSYNVDLDNGVQSDNMPGQSLRLVKDAQVAEAMPASVPTANQKMNPGASTATPATGKQVTATTQQTTQAQNTLKSSLSGLKAAGANIDPAQAQKSLQAASTPGATSTDADAAATAPLNGMVAKALSNPQLAPQLNTLLKQAGKTQ
jgi:hypothetical protein